MVFLMIWPMLAIAIRAANDQMGFSARYAITENFEICFDATHWLDQPGRRSVGGVRINF